MIILTFNYIFSDFSNVVISFHSKSIISHAIKYIKYMYDT